MYVSTATCLEVEPKPADDDDDDANQLEDEVLVLVEVVVVVVVSWCLWWCCGSVALTRTCPCESASRRSRPRAAQDGHRRINCELRTSASVENKILKSDVNYFIHLKQPMRRWLGDYKTGENCAALFQRRPT